MRGGDEKPRLPEALSDLTFMLGIHKGKQQGERHGLDPLFPQALDEG